MVSNTRAPVDTIGATLGTLPLGTCERPAPPSVVPLLFHDSPALVRLDSRICQLLFAAFPFVVSSFLLWQWHLVQMLGSLWYLHHFSICTFTILIPSVPQFAAFSCALSQGPVDAIGE